MELDEEMRRKIGLSVAVVGFFVVLLVGIGVTFDGGDLGTGGGLALVGSILLFVLAMGAVGVWLAK
ncbi:MAG: hypothetical protein ABEJ22_05380 [Haloferacaceae archaeon]